MQERNKNNYLIVGEISFNNVFYCMRIIVDSCCEGHAIKAEKTQRAIKIILKKMDKDGVLSRYEEDHGRGQCDMIMGLKRLTPLECQEQYILHEFNKDRLGVFKSSESPLKEL